MDAWHGQSVEGHVTMSGHVIVLGHVLLDVLRDHVMHHMIGQVIASQGHMPVSQGYMGKSSSLPFGYSLALGLD